MRPTKLPTKIFLDSGDPEETREALRLLGFLDGQTTNPTLIAKNPAARARFERGERFTAQEIFEFYRGVVSQISQLIPDGSVSLEVYADAWTGAEELFCHGKEMFSWIPNAHIKYPTTIVGLRAAERFIKEGMRVNMTLVFSEAQAAAVHAATAGAKKGDVFLSPFIGRLDDRGDNGMDLIRNCMDLYKNGDGHVEVLVASVRNLDHFLYSLALGADIITSPLKILREWADAGMPIPDSHFSYDASSLKPIPRQRLNLKADWHSIDIRHELTDAGIEKFAADWNALLGK